MIKTIFLVLIGALVAKGSPDVYWREYTNGVIPPDAFAGEPGLYIGQMPMNGILPGTIYPNRTSVVSECFSKRVEASVAIKILCSGRRDRLRWEYVNVANLTGTSLNILVMGGFEEGQILYIGKIFHEAQWKIGKVYPAFHNFHGLRVWTNSGDLYAVSDFQVLKYI